MDALVRGEALTFDFDLLLFGFAGLSAFVVDRREPVELACFAGAGAGAGTGASATFGLAAFALVGDAFGGNGGTGEAAVLSSFGAAFLRGADDLDGDLREKEYPVVMAASEVLNGSLSDNLAVISHRR